MKSAPDGKKDEKKLLIKVFLHFYYLQNPGENQNKHSNDQQYYSINRNISIKFK